MSSPSGPSPPPRRATTVRARAAETAPRDPRSERMRRGETEDWQNGRSVVRHTGRALLDRVYPAAPQHSATCATHHAIAHENKGVSRAHETWSRISRQATGDERSNGVQSNGGMPNQDGFDWTKQCTAPSSRVPRHHPSSSPFFPLHAHWCFPPDPTARQRIQTEAKLREQKERR